MNFRRIWVNYFDLLRIDQPKSYPLSAIYTQIQTQIHLKTITTSFHIDLTMIKVYWTFEDKI